MKTFGELLSQHMRRAGISDAEMARTLGVQRQTIFRWREGLVQHPRERVDVLRIASKLRLTPVERDELLLAAGQRPPRELPLLRRAGYARGWRCWLWPLGRSQCWRCWLWPSRGSAGLMSR